MKNATRYVALIMAVCSVICLFSVMSMAENSAPIAENLEISTYRGVSVGGCLSAVDPDGDSLTYEISTNPVKGKVELSEDGRFVYTPDDGKKGKDYFGYVAVDCEGNRSQEATVIIRIEKQKCSVSYSDMKGNGMYYSALLLAENDIYIGECIGGSYLFRPEAAVSRGEFLAMCMKVAGLDVLSGVTSTGFCDDHNIPGWIKPYVSTALMNGHISGYSLDGQAIFNSNADITFSEAVVFLNNILEITDSAASVDSASVPAWAEQSYANLSACQMLPAGIGSMNDSITRAEAAYMLAKALEIRGE